MSNRSSIRKHAQRVVARLSVHDLGDVPYVDILCMGDFHFGDAQADPVMVHDAMSWLLAEDNRYGIIAGDVLNMATRNSVSFEYGTVSPRESRENAVAVLRRAAHKILAVVNGNHDYRGEKEIGIDPLEWVCTELSIPYHGSEAAIQLKLGHYEHMAASKRSPVSYVGYIAHGCRGGRKKGSKMQGVLDYREVIPNCDFYLGGHGHDPGVLPDAAWVADTTTSSVKLLDQMFLVCGAALDRNLGQGYASRKAYKPLAKVFPILRLRGNYKEMQARTGDME